MLCVYSNCISCRLNQDPNGQKEPVCKHIIEYHNFNLEHHYN